MDDDFDNIDPLTGKALKPAVEKSPEDLMQGMIASMLPPGIDSVWVKRGLAVLGFVLSYISIIKQLVDDAIVFVFIYGVSASVHQIISS
jgi:hypothetical protein